MQVSVSAYPDGLGEAGLGSIPVWVMVVSIMTGLLVVVIITLILWRWGRIPLILPLAEKLPASGTLLLQ